MSDPTHAFHLMLAARSGELAHGALPLSAAQGLGAAAREALERDPIEITEDSPAERLLLHPPGARDLARAHRGDLRATALLDVPRDMDAEQAERWAREVLPGPPQELILLGEPEKGITLATQRALTRRHLVGRLPFARIRELNTYAKRLARARAQPTPPQPAIYVPRLRIPPLETAYHLNVQALKALLEDSGSPVRDLSRGWTQPGDLNAIVDEAGVLLLHLDLGRSGANANAIVVTVVHFDPAPGREEAKVVHEAYTRACANFEEHLPEDAVVASTIGWHFSVFLDRPVYSLFFAANRAKRPAAVEAVIDKYGIDTVVLWRFLPSDQSMQPYFDRRHELIGRTGGCSVYRVR